MDGQAAQRPGEGASLDPPPPPPPPVAGPLTATGCDKQKTSNLTDKSLLDAYILAIGLGFFGALHFYVGRPRFGVLYLFTFGLFGVGYIVDWFRVPSLVKEANSKLHADRETPSQKSLSDAYLLWFPLGLFGIHHLYLERWEWGVVYMLSFGLLGFGWLIDGIRMESMVNETNRKLEERGPPDPTRRLSDVYVLCLFPVTGLLGVHHYYLRRPAFGVLYTFTLGLLGVGWLVDIWRLKFLVARANKNIVDGDDGLKHEDDACVCLFPLGFLGFHHFYLKRPGWGLLYLCTCGLLGVGWIVDFGRMYILVKRANKHITEGDDGKKHLDDAYLCLFPLGFLGLHHFYLRRPGWGVLYLCTFGALGVGWAVDVFRLPWLVRECNGETPEETRPIFSSPPSYTAASSGIGNQGLVVAHPPSYRGGYPAGQYPAMPPGYRPAGIDSFSSGASGDVGPVFPPGYQQPPSYQEATGDGTGKDVGHQASSNKSN